MSATIASVTLLFRPSAQRVSLTSANSRKPEMAPVMRIICLPLATTPRAFLCPLRAMNNMSARTNLCYLLSWNCLTNHEFCWDPEPRS